MSQPHALPHDDHELEAGIAAALRLAVDRERPRPRLAAAAGAASPDGPPATQMWGPSSTLVTPLQLLSEVADNTARLQGMLEGLVTKITGENPPPKRIRPVPGKHAGLLPAISHLAHEIDQAHSELARLIKHVERQI